MASVEVQLSVSKFFGLNKNIAQYTGNHVYSIQNIQVKHMHKCVETN